MKIRNLRQLPLFFSLFIYIFTGCNNIFDETTSTPIKTESDIVYIKLNLRNTPARDIYPTVSIENFKGFVLSGKRQNQNDITLASGNNWEKISSKPIAIQTGTWDFTLQAFSNEDREFTATIENKEINTSTSDLNFELHAVDDLGNFSISVTVDKSNISTNTKLQVKFTLYKDNIKKFDPAPQVYEKTPLSFTPTNAYYFEPDNYDMEIQLIASDSRDESSENVVINTYTDTLHVIAGFSTVENLTFRTNPVYDIAYENNGGTISEGTAGPALFSRKSTTANLPILTKPGYKFLGWFDAETEGNNVTEVSTSVTTYYARFTPKSYTVKHYFQPVGTSTNTEDYVQDLDNYPDQTITVSGSPENETTNATAYTTIAGFENQEITQATTIAEDDSTVINVYYNRLSYNVTYTDAHGNIISGIGGSYQFGARVDIDFDNVPTNVGYDFSGWKKGSTTYTSTGTTYFTMGTSDVELTAKWTSHPYQVTFHYNGGKNNEESEHIEILDLLEDNTVGIEDFEPSRPPYIFDGWYTDAAFTEVFTMSEINLSNPNNNPEDFHDWDLYAKWAQPAGTPEGFAFVVGGTVEGAVNNSHVFVTGNTTIPDMYVCEHEVTQAEYEQYCTYESGSSSPSTSYGKGNNYAAYGTSWYDAIVYCNLRSAAENLYPVYKIAGSYDPKDWPNIVSSGSGSELKYKGPNATNDTTWDTVTCNPNANGYRLPTSAEWEYIARCGENGIPETQYTYSGSDTPGDVAWYNENSDEKIHEVKTKSANVLGIYDMSGNVMEWCWDNDGSGMNILRGGHYGQENTSCTVYNIGYNNPGICILGAGFRVIRHIPEFIGDKPYPTQAGDIVFNDGSAIAYAENISLTSDQQTTAIAVIFYNGTDCSNTNDEIRMLGIGLKQINSKCWTSDDLWSSKGISSLTDLTEINCIPDDNKTYPKTSSGITNDRDGRDNYSQIKTLLEIPEPEATDFPSFYWADTYAATYLTNLPADSEFTTGWYLPTTAELAQLAPYSDTEHTHMQLIQDAISLCGGNVELVTSTMGMFLTSSTSKKSGSNNKPYVFFTRTGTSYGTVSAITWVATECLCAIRQFN